MNLEQRILKLEKSNKYYKIALSVCICLFFISAKDVFVKDEIQVKKLIADEIEVNRINTDEILIESLEKNSNCKLNRKLTIDLDKIMFERITNWKDGSNHYFYSEFRESNLVLSTQMNDSKFKTNLTSTGLLLYKGSDIIRTID